MQRISEHRLPQEMREKYEQITLYHWIEGQEAIDVLQEIVQHYPGFVMGRLNLGALYLQAGDTDTARSIYSSINEQFPDEMGAVAGLATVLAEEGDLSEAEQLAKRALEGGYNWYRCYRIIVDSREAAGDLEAVAETCLAGYESDPHNWKFLQRYCELTGRGYHTPSETIPQKLSDDRLKDLFEFLNHSGYCDNTLRDTKRWALDHGVDVIELYQFLNSKGGFCDCEVVINVKTSLFGNPEDLPF